MGHRVSRLPRKYDGSGTFGTRPPHDPERFGSSSDPNPNDVDRSLIEVDDDKIRKYRADYNNNNPPTSISFIPAMTSTSGRLHSEFV